MNRPATVSPAALLLALSFLSAALVTPASANWFSTDHRHFVGSSINPRPQNLRGEHYYPAPSLAGHEQGQIRLKVWLTDEGTMSNATVETSSGFPRLDQAAIQYMKENYRYKPALGQPMPEAIYTVVSFRLD